MRLLFSDIHCLMYRREAARERQQLDSFDQMSIFPCTVRLPWELQKFNHKVAMHYFDLLVPPAAHKEGRVTLTNTPVSLFRNRFNHSFQNHVHLEVSSQTFFCPLSILFRSRAVCARRDVSPFPCQAGIDGRPPQSRSCLLLVPPSIPTCAFLNAFEARSSLPTWLRFFPAVDRLIMFS